MERVYRKQSPRKKGSEPSANPTGKLRVAAYVRTSTLMSSQDTSFETQIETYKSMINANPDWELVEIFADHGISGTQAKKRTEFMRMIQCCREGKIDRILTKSISRFARNTLDCIKYVRELSSLGITVLFEKEDIDTGSEYSEMILTVMAAFAQEESRSLSENCKWGIRKRFQEGICRWHRLYGYKKVGDEEYVIVEEEAKVIRKIFSLYESGLSTTQVAERLSSDGIKTPNGKDTWEAGDVNNVLSCEKYVGDLMMQKRVEDKITRHGQKNDGSIVPMYYVKDDHAPIIQREQYERVQKIKKMRLRGRGSVTYPFGTEYLKCPFCGTPLTRHDLLSVGSPWICEKCHKFAIQHSDVYSAVLRAIQKRGEFKSVQSVEYIMLQKYVDHIEIGKHENLNEKWVKVFYKDGTSTSAPTEFTKKYNEPTLLSKKVLAQIRSIAALLPDGESSKEGDH